MTDPFDMGDDMMTKPNPSFAVRSKTISLVDIADGLGAIGGGQDFGRDWVFMLDSLLLLKLSAWCCLRSLSRYGFVVRARCVSSIQSATCLSELMLSVSDFRRSRLFNTLDKISLTGFGFSSSRKKRGFLKK